MRCVAVSDIHMQNITTPEADLLIVSGDMTMRGSQRELNWFSQWLIEQPQKHKIWIAGNHELGIEQNPEWAEELAEKTKTIYLNDSVVEIEGKKFWGSPVTPWFCDWAFNRQRGMQIKQHWNLIPENLDVLITHGPPYGYGDRVPRGENVGCEDLLETLRFGLNKPPRFVVFGHIHIGYGRSTLVRDDHKRIALINASICDEAYKASNKPVEFEI
jgi:Icc-related predicted phosphoesterase